jgi:crotonobetainyl-CoA:carnitine CoA-transferase CaiB-like acyl-CoA transferase
MSKPFAGVRVPDLTSVIAGPLASYQLALMGAEVIKIEVPGIGDLARKMGAEAKSNEWEARLSAARVPVGPVLRVPDIARHPHVAARGLVQQMHVPALDQDVRVVGAGFQLGWGTSAD